MASLFECGDVITDVYAFLADSPQDQNNLRSTCREATRWYDITAGDYKMVPIFGLSALVPAADASSSSSGGATSEDAVTEAILDDLTMGVEGMVAQMSSAAYYDCNADNDGDEHNNGSAAPAPPPLASPSPPPAMPSWRFCPVHVSVDKDSGAWLIGSTLASASSSGGAVRDAYAQRHHLSSTLHQQSSSSPVSSPYSASSSSLVVAGTVVVNVRLLWHLARHCPPKSQEPPALKKYAELRELFALARERGKVWGVTWRGGGGGTDERNNSASPPLYIDDILGLLPPRKKFKDSQAKHGSGDGEADGSDDSDLDDSDDDDDDVFDPAKYGLTLPSASLSAPKRAAATSMSDAKYDDPHAHFPPYYYNVGFDGEHEPLLWFRRDFLHGINCRGVFLWEGERIGKGGQNFLSGSQHLEKVHRLHTLVNATDLGKGFLSHSLRLKRVELHHLKQLMTLRDDSLSGCHALRSVTLPRMITDIGDDCFRDCGSLRSFDLVNLLLLVRIGDGFLSRCQSLLKVTIKGTPLLEAVGKDCLFGAASLRRMIIDTTVDVVDVAAGEGNAAMAEPRADGQEEPQSHPVDPSPILTIEEGFLKGCPQLLERGNATGNDYYYNNDYYNNGVGGGGGGGGYGLNNPFASRRQQRSGAGSASSRTAPFCTTNLYLAPNGNHVMRTPEGTRYLYFKRQRQANAAASASSPSVGGGGGLKERIARRRGGAVRQAGGSGDDDDDGEEEGVAGATATSPSSPFSHLAKLTHEELTGRKVTYEEETAGCVIC